MKYYESNYEEYVSSLNKYNLHPELESLYNRLPDQIDELPNLLFYGPPGVGKYSQMLRSIYSYSPSKFKYDKKITIGSEKPEKKTKVSNTVKESSSTSRKGKNTSGSGTSSSSSPSTTNPSTSSSSSSSNKKSEYSYRISDIHYEIDMSTLGCNPKTLWHEIFFQIVDIISVKPHKTGIIVCKNFHMIYNELLDIFHSYVRHPFYNIKIRFILLTEQISFIPDSIVKNFLRISVRRPSKEQYMTLAKSQSRTIFGQQNGFRITNGEKQQLSDNLDIIQCTSLINCKEMHILKQLQPNQLPMDVFNTVTDVILEKLLDPRQIEIQTFRNDLYDLLIYNIEITDVLFYIITFLLEKKQIDAEKTHDILQHCFTFLKYYNNNYRPIYHLENMIFFILQKIHFNTSL